MTSTGERRWASARRGGMTVLGKVAVPKPINLPSQRLENHGMDPSVEIVPKGTHSWGNRSSSSTTNAWGSTASSPNNDGGSGSPSYLSGRPSSGGSGTRPSTAGSDRAHEPNAWGPNSRPSSASGALTSNQTSLASLRPRSAETRPGSSQLSRFAEPLSDNSVAWGGPGTVEKLGVTSSKNDGFSLTSGDFPTLGSEKESSGKSTDSQDHVSHGRPGSSSGGAALVKEMTGNSVGDVAGNSNARNGSAGSWRRENHMYGEDEARGNVGKWQTDPQPYPNSNIPPRQYDAWHGPPVNSHPGGVWYRGPPGGPPFGSPVAPGGFPMEPFPYYRPQMPPAAIANPQPVPPPGAGPRGPHPKNGDMYRPRIPDAYMRPGMPIRPGFYPGPVPYDSYYGPPVGYCNSNEQDIPFMGMPMGPAAYNRYSGPNAPDPGNSHGRSGGYGPGGKGMVPEQMESGNIQDARRPYKVLLKQHDGWEGKDEKWDDTATVIAPVPGKGDHRSKSSWENGWRTDHKIKEMDIRRKFIGEETSSESVDNQVSDSMKVKSPESVGNFKASTDGSVNNVEQEEHLRSVFPEVSSGPREPSLIQKIEGLNAKARASDGKQDAQSASNREEHKNKLQAGDGEKSQSIKEVGTGSVSHESRCVDMASHEDRISGGEKNLESVVASGTTTSRKPNHGGHGRSDQHGRADHRGRGRFNAQETDGWRKKSQVTDSPILASTEHLGSSVVHGPDRASMEAAENSGSYSPGKEGESVPPVSEPSDSQSQRAKMRELAKQRFKQREKEEEERARDQRAKALAKLEELNRRTLAGEVLSQTVPDSAIQIKQEESSTHVPPTVVACASGAPSSILGSNTSAIAESSESRVKGAEISSSLSCDPLLELKSAHEESVVVHDQLEPVNKEVNISDSARRSNGPLAHDSSASKQKRMSYRQKQNSYLEKNSAEKLTSCTIESSKGDTDVAADATVSLEGNPSKVSVTSESSSVNSSGMSESSVHHKRKNRTGKNKHRVEEASSLVALSSKDTTALDTSVESSKAETPESGLDPNSVQVLIESKDANQSSEQNSVLSNDEVPARVNNQWKSHQPRRTLRNSHSNKSTEKFQSGDAVIWAPVRPQNKNEVSDEASQRAAVEAVIPATKNDPQVQNNPRNKRAEMERYIPKPVAKEMAQQGSGYQSVAPPMSQMMSEETVGKAADSLVSEGSQNCVPVAGKVGSTADSRNGDGRLNKSGKVHGAWRQRGAAESATVSSSPNRIVQKPIEHHQRQKPDLSSGIEQPSSDKWGASDGWFIPEQSDAPITVPDAKDHGTTVRGKRQPYKGHKGTGHNHHLDEKRGNSGDTEKACIQSSVLEMNQSELQATMKENRSIGDRSASHWQPKSSSFPASNERGSRSNNSQNAGSEVGKVNKKDSTRVGVVLPPQSYKDSVVAKDQHHHDQSMTGTSNLEETRGTGHQEAKRGRKVALHNGRPGSPVDPSSSNVDVRHEQRGSSGFRKNGNHNSRFREHEHHGDWSGSVKDNRQYNAPAQRERHRHSSHYEYQPIGPQYNNNTDNVEHPKDGSHNSYARSRERGQVHPRRGGGNFNARQTGNV